MTDTGNFKNESLLLYVIDKLKDNPNSGAVLLNKVLYYVDNIHFLKHGRPISSFTYIKQDNGPTPDPRIFMPLRQKMLEEGKIEMQEIEKFGKIQKKLIPKKQSNVDDFTAEEVELIDMVINDCKEYTAIKISEFSHQEMAWRLANKFEQLPYYTYLLTNSEIDQDDIDWGRERLRHRESMSYN